MAYGLKYRDKRGANPRFTIDIYKDGYSGAVTDLIVENTDVTYSDIEYFQNIVTKSVVLTIFNNFTNFFELDELLSSYDRQYYVTIKNLAGEYIFEGYILSDISTQVYLHGQSISVTATDGLKKLENFNNTLFVNVNVYTLISIIKECLSFTYLQNSTPIYVNCSLRETRQTTSNRSVFDQSWVESELFQKNENETDNCYNVLEIILKHFNCALYYWNNGWYIERMKDLGAVNKKYIKYLTNGSQQTYNITETTLKISNDPSIGSPDLIAIDQVINYNPAYKTLKVKLDFQDYDNQINGYLTPCTSTTKLPSIIQTTDVSARAWIYDASYFSLSVGRNNYGMNTYVDLTMDQYVLNEHNMMGFYHTSAGYFVPNTTDNYLQAEKGIYTKMNLTPVEDLSIDLTYKYRCSWASLFAPYEHDGEIMYDSPELQRYLTSYTPIWVSNNPNMYSFVGRAFIKIGDSPIYLQKCENVASPFYNQIICSSSNVGRLLDVTLDRNLIFEHPVNFTSFTDRDNFMTEFKHTIKLSAECVSTMNYLGSTQLIVGLLMPGFKDSLSRTDNALTKVNSVTTTLRSAILGDINVAVKSPSHENNYIVAALNSKYENTYEDEFLIFDCADNNVKNSLFINASRTRTNMWVDDFSTNQKSLIDKNIEDRFQIFNKVRNFFECNLYDYKNTLSGNLKPFTLMYDSYIDKDFFLNGYKISLNEDCKEFSNVKLFEYVDNDGYY